MMPVFSEHLEFLHHLISQMLAGFPRFLCSSFWGAERSNLQEFLIFPFFVLIFLSLKVSAKIFLQLMQSRKLFLSPLLLLPPHIHVMSFANIPDLCQCFLADLGLIAIQTKCLRLEQIPHPLCFLPHPFGYPNYGHCLHY